MRQYRVDFEPSAAHPFDDLWERKLTSVQQVKGEKFRRVEEIRHKRKQKRIEKYRECRVSFGAFYAGNAFANIYESIT